MQPTADCVSSEVNEYCSFIFPGTINRLRIGSKGAAALLVEFVIAH